MLRVGEDSGPGAPELLARAGGALGLRLRAAPITWGRGRYKSCRQHSHGLGMASDTGSHMTGEGCGLRDQGCPQEGRALLWPCLPMAPRSGAGPGARVWEVLDMLPWSLLPLNLTWDPWDMSG